jgi:hypothetical protein
MHQRPDDSLWPGTGNLVPPELLHTREWLHEMFQQAGKGLPWPHQMSLMLIEQAIMVGMFGGLLASAWSLTQQRTGTDPLPAAGPFDLNALIGQLETHATSALPDQVQVAIRHVRAYLDQQGVERAVGDMWNQVWGPNGPQPPFPPGSAR